LRHINRQIFELKKTNTINNSTKNFCVSKDFFNIVVKDKKDFRINIAKDFEILEDFRKTIYLNKEINAKENCFKDKIIANFYFANIRATILIFLIIVEF